MRETNRFGCCESQNNMRGAWKFFITGSVLLAIGVIAPDIVLAQCTDGFCPLADVKGTKLATLYSDTGGDLSIFIGRLFGFALSIGAILAILRIAWGGYLYMTTDLWSTKERAREVLRETVLGLLLLLAVWVILRQINPAILDLNLSITPAPTVNVEQRATEAGTELMARFVEDTVTPPTDYTRTVSPTPIPGYYCYESAVAPGNYACLTNAAICDQLARVEGASCSSY